MKIKTSFLVILVLSMPAISAKHSDMKIGGIESSASSQAYVSGMNEMHEKMMATIEGPNSDKVFVKDMIAHHEGAIAMAEAELKYGKDPETRKLTEDIIKAQKGEIDQINKWLDNQK